MCSGQKNTRGTLLIKRGLIDKNSWSGPGFILISVITAAFAAQNGGLLQMSRRVDLDQVGGDERLKEGTKM